jgi:hypothetical protein
MAPATTLPDSSSWHARWLSKIHNFLKSHDAEPPRGQAPLPPDEPERLKALRQYDILDAEPDGACERGERRRKRIHVLIEAEVNNAAQRLPCSIADQMRDFRIVQGKGAKWGVEMNIRCVDESEWHVVPLAPGTDVVSGRRPSRNHLAS